MIYDVACNCILFNAISDLGINAYPALQSTVRARMCCRETCCPIDFTVDYRNSTSNKSLRRTCAAITLTIIHFLIRTAQSLLQLPVLRLDKCRRKRILPGQTVNGDGFMY
jgi:hypothetical protein